MIRRPAGSCGSWGDDGRYQDWYRYEDIELERIPDVRGCNAEARAPNDVRTNGAERRLVLESLRVRVYQTPAPHGTKVRRKLQ